MPGGLRVLDDLLQGVRRATLARRATPAVVHHVGPPGRIRVLPLEIRGRHEELEALGVGRRRSVPLIHVPAADPLRAGCDADLIGPGCRRHRRRFPSRVCRGRSRRTAPGGSAYRCRRRCGSRPTSCSCGPHAPVPAPVLRLERVVRPAVAGVLDGDDDAGAVEAEGPDVRGLDLVHTGLDDFRSRTPRSSRPSRRRTRQLPTGLPRASSTACSTR